MAPAVAVAVPVAENCNVPGNLVINYNYYFNIFTHFCSQLNGKRESECLAVSNIICTSMKWNSRAAGNYWNKFTSLKRIMARKWNNPRPQSESSANEGLERKGVGGQGGCHHIVGKLCIWMIIKRGDFGEEHINMLHNYAITPCRVGGQDLLQSFVSLGIWQNITLHGVNANDAPAKQGNSKAANRQQRWMYGCVGVWIRCACEC